MQHRQLGDSGLLVSEIVLGTVPFGGRAEFAKCGAVDVPTAKRMFDIAFEAGLNMVDTADLYSHGLAEEVVGQALDEKRNTSGLQRPESGGQEPEQFGVIALSPDPRLRGQPEAPSYRPSRSVPAA